MTELTINNLNCKSCDHHTENAYTHFCGGYPAKLLGVIQSRGCASHSLALQVRTKLVIEELEKLYQVALSKDDIAAYKAYDQAIRLIKNGVPK